MFFELAELYRRPEQSQSLETVGVAFDVLDDLECQPHERAVEEQQSLVQWHVALPRECARLEDRPQSIGSRNVASRQRAQRLVGIEEVRADRSCDRDTVVRLEHFELAGPWVEAPDDAPGLRAYLEHVARRA